MGKSAWLCLVLAAVTVAAGGLLVTDAASPPQLDEASAEFQRLVGGLGLGPALTLRPCPATFDRRLSPNWRAEHPPLVGGEYFCPLHGSSVFPLGRLAGPATEPVDADLP